MPLENYLNEQIKQDPVSFHYKSHEEMYDVAIETSINTAKALRKLQQERNPGGSNIWP